VCEFASFVLTKDRVFWSDKTDSHERLIRDNELIADGPRGPNVLRVEICPGEWGKPGTWQYRIDQDRMPEWYDAQADEARARTALRKRLAQPHWRAVTKFIREIPTLPWGKPDGRPLKAWRVFHGQDLAAARAAARAAAGAAAWDAARDAAWAAAGAAARAAARDAALYAGHLIAGEGFDQKHADHIVARWRVWQKGYCLLCDVDGVLYVYAVRKPTPTTPHPDGGVR